MPEMEFLATVPLFASLSSEELEKLAAHLVVIEKKENDIIFKKGDTGHAFYIVQEGSVKIVIPSAKNEDLILSVLHKGEVFGELTLFEKIPRTASAIVFERATLLEMPHNKFIDFLKAHPDVSINMLAMLGKRIRETNAIMASQTTRNVNDELERELTFGERVSDKFAEFIGSWTFIILFSVLLIVWIILNVYAILFVAVDPYPFILLNLILSCLAAIQAPVIMMSQGRQSKKDQIAADLDYKINLKAELQVQEIRVHIDQLTKQGQREFKELRRMNTDLLKKHEDILARLEKTKDS